MKAYKLFRVKKDGSLTSLFINKGVALKTGTWLRAKKHPTDGFAVRRGWHCLPEPVAPHLSTKGRKWYRVSVKGVTKLSRPHGQGTIWYIAKQMKILRPYGNPTTTS